MADNMEEEEAADGKEQPARDTQEMIEGHEEAEVDDAIQGLEDSQPVTPGIQEFSQEEDGEHKSEPHEAAAVEDEEEEVRKREEIPTEDEDDKAEITEAADVAAGEENEQHEYIDAGEEATIGAPEKENEMEQVQGDTAESDDVLSATEGHIFGEEQVQDGNVEAGEMLRVDPPGLEVTIPGSLSRDSEPTGEQDKQLTDQGELEVTEEPPVQRIDLIEQYFNTVAKRNKLHSRNFQVQTKLFEYLRKKKPDVDPDKSVSEYEQRYLKLVAQFEDLMKFNSAKREHYEAVIEETKERSMEKKSRAERERNEFIEMKENVLSRSINSQTGQPVPAAEIEQYVDLERRKEQEVVQKRLENIKLINKMKSNQQQIKLKEQVSEGLRLIDFEQLKIENQTYNEKIEERNEELLKLRKKIMSTVLIISHLKEKLQFVQAETIVKNKDLKEVDATLAHRRDILSRTKQARDSLKIDNFKLQQKCGFLGNESLLRDFEQQKGENTELQYKLHLLKQKHSELTLRCNHVRQKVEQACSRPDLTKKSGTKL